jgi:hypothetical protein
VGKGWLETGADGEWNSGRCIDTDRASLYVKKGVRVRPSGSSEKSVDEILQ